MKNGGWKAFKCGICSLVLLGVVGELAGGDFPDGIRAEKVFTSPDARVTFVIADDGELYTWGYRVAGTPRRAIELVDF